MSGWTDLRRTAEAARLDPYARVADAETILELLDERDLLAARLDLMTREARLSRESTEKAVRRAERAVVDAATLADDEARDREGWQDETVADLLESARRIVEQTSACTCPDEPHQNALHDLAHDAARALAAALSEPVEAAR